MREEEKKRTSQKSLIQRLRKNRWALPAIYIASAAIILAGTLWFQSNSQETPESATEDNVSTGKNQTEPAVEVNSKIENISLPVANGEETVIKTQFYDMNGSEEEQEAALVSYNNQFYLNKGIDIGMNDGKEFDVLASISGKVSKVQEDSLNGNLVEIEHENGVVTRYQSIKDIKVEVGDQVTKGQALAKSGQSLINEKAGIHVHFEIRQADVALNPVDFLDKPLSSIQASEPIADDENETSADEEVEEESTEDSADLKPIEEN